MPYNWDSMTYHLSRMVHWVNNKSVAHYATHTIRELATPGLHEFICTNVYVLSGGRDLFINLIQTCSFLTNAWLIYEIAKKFGVQAPYAKGGVLLFLSMPIAFGEALTTQNDQLGTVFFLIFVYYIIDFWKIEKSIVNDKETRTNCYIMGAMVGFGFLTKPTVSMGMFFLAVVLLVICIRRKDSIVDLIKLIVPTALIIAVIIVPEMARNIATFGAIFPHVTGARQLVGTLEPRYLLVNGLKNFAFNLPSVYISNSTQLLVNGISTFARIIGVDIDHPSISEDGREFLIWGAREFGHDTAVNSAVMFIAIACVLWCIYRGKKTDVCKRMYTYVIAGLFILFCMLVRWEPFVSRYMLPYLALLCPMIAIWIEDMAYYGKNKYMNNVALHITSWIGLTGLIVVASYHIGIAREQMFHRPEGYFQNRKEIYEDYKNVNDIVEIAGYKRIGLIMMEDEYKYPLQYMLKYDAKRIENVIVTNESSKYEDLSYKPDCVLTTSNMDTIIEIHGAMYERVEEVGMLYVYERIE